MVLVPKDIIRALGLEWSQIEYLKTLPKVQTVANGLERRMKTGRFRLYYETLWSQ